MTHVFDINAQVDRFFDDASVPAGQPVCVLLMGGTGSGKTTIRQERYATGYALLDAATIFISLTGPTYFDFPHADFEMPLNAIGSAVAERAIRERRNLVVEFIGADVDPMKRVIEALTACGYKVDLQFIDCDVTEAWNRNLNRGPDNISAYYTEPYHVRWLLAATAAG